MASTAVSAEKYPLTVTIALFLKGAPGGSYPVQTAMGTSPGVPARTPGLSAGPPQMNVSLEADRAFMQELNRTDSPRYCRLVKAIQMAHYTPAEAPSGLTCHYIRCSGSVAHLRVGTRFCSAACKMKSQRQCRRS